MVSYHLTGRYNTTPTLHAGCSRTAFHHHANISPIRMTDNEQWAKWLFYLPPWSHLEGTTFWQSRCVKCACCDCFFPCRMNVFTVEQWSQTMSLAASRNKSERRRRWAWQPHGTNWNDTQYGRVRLGEVVFYAIVQNFIMFVQNRFVMQITRCTGTSVLCISIVYVHRAHYFMNTTAILLCFRRIDLLICHVHNLLHT